MIPIIASPRSALRSRGPHSELSEAQPRFWPVLWLLLDPGCGQGWVGLGWVYARTLIPPGSAL